MGSSNSTLDMAKLVRSLLSDTVAPAEQLTQLLNATMTAEETSQAFPAEQLRRLRHLYTHNFAALLYRCIGAVAAVAVQRHEINTSASAPAAALTPEVLAQYHSALRILRCLLPLALESGTTPLEEEEEDVAGGAAVPDSGAVPPSTPSEGDAAPAAPEAATPAAASASSAAAATAAPRARTAATAQFQQLFFVEGKTCEDAKPDETFSLLPRQNVHLSPSQPYAKPLPLGTFLVWSLVECCFVRGLTLPDITALPKEPVLSITHAEVDTGLLWAPGLASIDPMEALASRSSGPSFSWTAPRLPRQRKAVLDVLFAALSSPLYHAAGFRDTIFLEPLLSTSTVPLMPTLSISMLNTVLQYVPYGYLPYTSHLGVEERELVMASARVLNATLCYVGIPLDSINFTAERQGGAPQPAPASAGNGAPGASGAAVATAAENEGSTFSHPDGARSLSITGAESSNAPDRPRALSQVLLSSNSLQRNGGSAPATPSLSHLGPPRFVHSVRKALRDITLTEAKALLQRMQGILSVNAYSTQTYLPVSQTTFSCLDDFMLLFWKILDLSPACLAQFGTNPHALEYVVPILDYALAVRRSPLYTYHFQLMLFVLTRLSEVRGFVVQCNQQCTATLPFRFPKEYEKRTYNDIIVMALCLVMDMKDLQAVVPLFPSCTVVLANMAPFITALGREPSMKIVSVFAHVAYHCLRTVTASQPSTPAPGQDAGSGAAAATTPSSHSAVLQAQMVNLCEAIASLVQYQRAGSLYLIASLVDHRSIVREVREAYVVHRTHVLTVSLPLPFLINTLDAAVAVALPVVESTDALRKITKYYVDTTSETTVNNVTAALEVTRTFAPPVGMGEPGAGLAASDEAVNRLRSITFVGVLPTPHSIIIRKFQSTKNIEQWTTTTFWTSAYIHSPSGLLGDRDSVRLVQFA